MLKLFKRGQEKDKAVGGDDGLSASVAGESATLPAKYYGRPPWLLRYRSSTTFISLCIWLGLVVDTAGYSLIIPVIPFRLQEINETNIPGKTGWLVAAYAGGLVVSSPPISYLGTLIRGKRIPLLLSLLCMAGATILFMETSSYPVMVVARVLQGFSGTGIFTLGLALTADSVRPDRLGVVAGTILSGYSLGQVMGPPIGGVLYDRLGYRAPFIFSLILIAIDFALRLLVIEKHIAIKWITAGNAIPNFESPYPLYKEDETTSSSAAPTMVEPPPREVNTWEGVKRLMTDMRPVTACLFIFIEGLALGGLIESGMTLRLEEHYGLNALGAGLVFIGLVVPTIITSPIAGWASDRYTAKWVVVFGAVLTLPVYPLLTLSSAPLPLFIFFLALLGVSLAMFITPVVHDLGVYTATVPGLNSLFSFGAFNMFYSIGAFLGPIVVGQAMENLGVPRGWLAMCIFMPAFTLVCLPFAVIYLGDRLYFGRRSSSVEGEEEKKVEAVEAPASATTTTPQPIEQQKRVEEVQA